MQLSLMGIQFEKLKKNSTGQPIPVKQGWVRGSKNIFKVGLAYLKYASKIMQFADAHVGKVQNINL